jgi:hypothetical protein
MCLNPEHGVVRLFDPTKASGQAQQDEPCLSCLAGDCEDPEHKEAPLEPVKIFDIRRSTFPRSLPPCRPSRVGLDLRPRLSSRKPRIEINGVELVEALTTQPVPGQAGEAKLISAQIGCQIGTSMRFAIPKIIHRFWTGGPMRTPAFKALYYDGQKATSAGWQSRMWFSSIIEEMLDQSLPDEKRLLRQSQRDTLKLAGYVICDIHDGPTQRGIRHPLTQLAQAAAQSVLNGAGYDNVKYFSDLARLLYLEAYGGIHIDVDMLLGDIDLSRTYYHNDANGQVPLLGTLARDNSDREVVERLSFLRESRRHLRVNTLRYEEAVGFLARRAVQGAGMFNALIASCPHTRHLAIAIQEYLRRGYLFTGMTLNRFLLMGDPPGNPMLAQAALARSSAESVPPYLLALDQITAESDE